MYDKQFDGLTTAQAEKLSQQFGLNTIEVASTFTLFASFIRQISGVLPILLLVAGSISLFLGEYLDSFFIYAVVLLNVTLGVYQEQRAEKSLLALKKITVSKTRVMRDGHEIEIENSLIVPGDIIYLVDGAKIPADGQILKSWHLEVNEASLTGESVSVYKTHDDPESNQVFLGTIVTKGRAYARVTHIGKLTRFGSIAQQLANIKPEESPLQKKINTFTKHMGALGISASTLIFIMSFLRDRNLFESFFFAISLAVAAVPEGLPTVMTITTAIGIEKMAQKKTIIRKLSAVESLGSITVLATDKTGTLTTNKMSVQKLFVDNQLYSTHTAIPVKSRALDILLTNGIVCSTTSLIYQSPHSFDFVGDSTEAAILFLAHKNDYNPEEIKKKWEILDEKAFDQKLKRMIVIAQNQKNTNVFAKGTPESIISMCNRIQSNNSEGDLTEEKRKIILEKARNMAKDGLRLVAFSYKNHNGEGVESDHIFLGFVGIADPLRPQVHEAVTKAQLAGIRVVMITGDNELTASKIAIEAGIMQQGNDVLTGSQLDDFSDEELIAVLPKVAVFARTTPEHKLRLVSLLQKMGEIVAVTGDGVNDALALKQAHIGIAMGITGTDVAKETADVVITDDNFATFIDAIEEGRNIFIQIKNSILYLLTTNTAEIFAVLLSFAMGLPVILTAFQILYINLISDGLPALSFAFMPKNTNVMSHKPKKHNAFLTRSDYLYIGIFGLFGSILTIASYVIGLHVLDFASAQTMAFTTLIMMQPFILIDLWISKKLFLPNMKKIVNGAFLGAVLFPLIIHPFLLYVPFLQSLFDTKPLGLFYLSIALMYALAITIPLEGRKLTFLFRH